MKRLGVIFVLRERERGRKKREKELVLMFEGSAEILRSDPSEMA